jgi:hypothetical protein
MIDMAKVLQSRKDIPDRTTTGLPEGVQMMTSPHYTAPGGEAPMPDYNPYATSGGGSYTTNPWTAQPTGMTNTGATGGLYSTDWLKGLNSPYAKNWGGQAGTEQAWYRTPEWGSGLLWNPYYGFQSGSTVKGKYAGGPLSNEAFYGMGLTRNPGEDWQQYYQQLTGMTPEQGNAMHDLKVYGTGAGGYGTAGGGQMTSGTPGSYGYDFSSYFPEYGQATNLQLPQELDWASQALGEMSATGRPTSWSPWYQQAKETVNTDVMDAIKQAAEKAGMGGTRWGTPMGRTAQDISSRAFQNLGTTYTGQELGALENAANRSLSAAQGLGNVAQQRWNMPLQYANQAMGMGQNMQQQYQNMFNPQYQEFLRTAAENNPWMNMGMGLTNLTGQYTPQTYQPSFLGQLLGGVTSLLPGMDWFKKLFT